MKKHLLFIALVLSSLGCKTNETIETIDFTAVCNPINVSYRFRPQAPSRREAADPTVITYKGEYYLFASKSGGYWYSKDMASWTFVLSNDIPTEDYAPTAIVLRDTIFMSVSAKTSSA